MRVAPLLTSEFGFKGNAADPVPQDGMPEQIRVVKEQFGVGELAFVGTEAW